MNLANDLQRIRSLKKDVSGLLGVERHSVNQTVSFESMETSEEVKHKNLMLHDNTHRLLDSVVKDTLNFLDTHAPTRYEDLKNAGLQLAYALKKPTEEFIDSNGRFYMSESDLQKLRDPLITSYFGLFDVTTSLRPLPRKEDINFEQMIDVDDISKRLALSKRFLRIGGMFTTGKEAEKQLTKLNVMVTELEPLIKEQYDTISHIFTVLLNRIKNNEDIAFAEKPFLDKPKSVCLDSQISSELASTIERIWFGRRETVHPLSDFGKVIEMLLRDPLSLSTSNTTKPTTHYLNDFIANTSNDAVKDQLVALRQKVSFFVTQIAEVNRNLDRFYQATVSAMNKHSETYMMQTVDDILYYVNEFNIALLNIMSFFLNFLKNIDLSITNAQNFAKVVLTHRSYIDEYKLKRVGK